MSKIKISILSLLSFLSYATSNVHLKDWMDTSITPQQDFYLYSNGQWIKKNPIPEDYSRWSIFDILEKKNQDELIQLIKSIPHQPLFSSQKINQQIFQYYSSGMNTAQIEKEKIRPLLPMIQEIHHINSSQNLSPIIAKLHDMGVNVFFQVSSMNDLHHSKDMIGGIVQDGLNLPHRDYYLKNDMTTQKIQNAYIEFLEKIFIELHYSNTQAKNAALQTFEIEKKLAEFSLPQEYFRNPKNIDHQSYSEKLTHQYPALDLNQYFQFRGLSSSFLINNCTPNYLQKLNHYLPTLGSQELQNYLIAHLVFQYSNNLHQDLNQSYCQLSIKISGSKKCIKKQDLIIKELNEYLGFAIGDLYVKTHLQAGSIDKINQMIEEIKDVLEKHLKNSWMSASTKTKALTKLKYMKARVGFNPFKIDYQSLNIKDQSYVSNAIALISFETKRQLLKIGHQIQEDEWSMAPQSINAYYDVSQNQINIPLGILQAPFFDIHATDAMNYGGIGAVIGHEMSHGFDDQGAQFNEYGQFKSWWTPKDWKTYQTKVNCIIQQYSSYPVQGHPHHHLNGKLVSGEAIADLMGINLSYHAFLKNHPIDKEPNIEEFTPMQQFYLNYAHIWAANMRDEEALKRSLIDAHPPMNIRVNGTLQNMPKLGEIFHISPSKKPYCILF